MYGGTILCLLLVTINTVYSADKYITVKSSTCGDVIDVKGNDAYLTYNGGGSLGYQCKYEFNTKFSADKLCVEATSFNVGCDTTVEYYGGLYTSFADKTYTCSQKPYSDYCTSFSTLYIEFKGNRYESGTSVALRIYEKNNSWGKDAVQSVVTSVYVIIGVIAGVVVLVIVIIVVTVICCCNRRRAAGTVYRSPQQATNVTVQGTYPPVQGGVVSTAGYQNVTQQQVGYQPPQQQMGYQSYPQQQPSYQPPPQGYAAGYQPPQAQGGQPSAAGYPPAPQQAMAGYQHTPDLKAKEASAPPMGPDFHMQNMEAPPPYPGN